MLKLNNTSTSRAKEKETGLGRQKLGNLSVIDMPLEPKNQGTIIRKDASQTDRMQGMRMRVQSKMIQNSLRLVFRQGIVSPFSRMRSKGSRFTLGVWGLRVCSLDVASASATVRNRPRDPHMAVPMGSFPEVVLFGVFRRVVASFRVAGVALRDIQTCSGTCRKSFCVAGAILL